MYNTSNPAELYPNTTWELLPDNKFIKTGSTPLQQAGSNSIKITKANLPAEKLQIESHSMTRGSMEITGDFYACQHPNQNATKAFTATIVKSSGFDGRGGYNDLKNINFTASRSWTGSTSSASPYTTAMGSGTPLTINPEHITIKAWKRLS